MNKKGISKQEKTALKTALTFPEIKSSINRQKAYWKTTRMSDEILARWVKHTMARKILMDILQQPLDKVLYLYQKGRSP